MPDLTGFIPLFALLPAIAGAAIALSVYRLSVVQRQDAWLRTLWDFQRAFWQDEKMERVRSWIASNEAYKEVQPVLKKHMDQIKSNSDVPIISVEEYKLLDMIDRFAALLAGYIQISPKEFASHKQSQRRLFDEYWITQINESRRPELYFYVAQFFPEIFLDDSATHIGNKPRQVPNPFHRAGLRWKAGAGVHLEKAGAKTESV